MTDTNVDSTSEEEMTYLPDLEKAQAKIKELEADLKAAKDVLANQEIRIRRYEQRFSDNYSALNDVLLGIDTARNKVRGCMDFNGFL